MENSVRPGVNPILARTLASAIEVSSKPKRDIARETGLHKDALLGVIRGTRAVTTDEAMRLLGATGVPPYGILSLALCGQEDLALDWMHRDIGLFWEEVLLTLPSALSQALGEDVAEIRPRWAAGTSRLVAKLVAEHVREVINRDLSLR
jgi:plasmid maintenance system antidote protein VapI